jgi:hypothetical protein
MGVPIREQAKIQARVLVPLVEALQAELGEERASALAQPSLHAIRYGWIGGLRVVQNSRDKPPSFRFVR